MALRTKIGKCDGLSVYLTDASWDCDWYWGLGYIDNRDFHTHMDCMELKKVDDDELECKLEGNDSWSPTVYLYMTYDDAKKMKEDFEKLYKYKKEASSMHHNWMNNYVFYTNSKGLQIAESYKDNLNGDEQVEFFKWFIANKEIENLHKKTYSFVKEAVKNFKKKIAIYKSC